MAIGSFLISATPFLFIFADTNIQIILLQILHGLGSAMASPGWLAIFTRHVDRSREAEEWGFYSSFVGLGGALTGALGGFMADAFGFRMLFLIVGLICTFGTSFLFFCLSRSA